MLSEGGLKDGEERDQLMEEDSTDAELLSGYQWLLQDLPKLPLFESVRGMTSTALQQVSSREGGAETPPRGFVSLHFLMSCLVMISSHRLFTWKQIPR